MPSSEYDLGTLVGKVRFDIPESEKRKMDVLTQRSGDMDRFYNSFSRSGGAMAATVGAFTDLVSKGGGVQSVINAMGSLAQAMLDIATLPLLPVMMTVMGGMSKVTENLMAAANSPAGMMEAIFDPNTYEPMWSALGEAMSQIWDMMPEDVRAFFTDAKQILLDVRDILIDVKNFFVGAGHGLERAGNIVGSGPAFYKDVFTGNWEGAKQDLVNFNRGMGWV